MLLIVSNKDDFAVDFLITRLEEKEIGYFRLDSDDAIDLRCSVKYCHSNQSAILATDEREIDTDCVSAVWYRRSISPTNLSAISPEFRNFARQELRHLLEGVLPEDDRIWVNPIGATERAERKLRQLRIAPTCGLRIPSTIVSNNLHDLREFANGHERVICKPISQGLVAHPPNLYAVHTWEVAETDLEEAGEFGNFPTLLQELIPKGLDIRLTIIGQEAFPVAINVPTDSGIDWRSNQEGLSYRPYELPQCVIENCKTFLRRLGLRYGAFDFVRSPQGELFFLEVNPAGEWAWLELELGLPLRDSFIALFQGQNDY